jgi:hypothetical protein
VRRRSRSCVPTVARELVARGRCVCVSIKPDGDDDKSDAMRCDAMRIRCDAIKMSAATRKQAGATGSVEVATSDPCFACGMWDV